MIYRTCLLGVLFLGLMGASGASADTWVANCKGLEFRFDRRNSRADIYMITDNRKFKVISGAIEFDNGVAVRSPVPGIPWGVQGPSTEIGLNKSRGMVYVLYRGRATAKAQDGIFCKTRIKVVP